MKKYFILAAAALILGACSNNDENESLNNEIRLTTHNVKATRTLDQTLQATQFANGTEVSVFINEDSENPTTTYDQPLVYTADGIGNLTYSTAQYYPNNGNGINVYGIHPTGYTMDEANSCVISVQTDQSTDENYNKSDFMFGKPASNPVYKSNDPINLIFTHELSKINVNLIAGTGYTSKDLEGTVVSIAGTGTVAQYGRDGDANWFELMGEAATIIVGTMDTNLKGSAIIIPQEVGAGDFLLFQMPEAAGGGNLVYQLSDNGASFESGKVYTYNISFTKSGINITTEITDWSDGGSVNGTAIVSN